MKIGVFIVAFNAEKTINSVLSRISKNTWELISEVYIFDDSSHDDTVIQAKSYNDLGQEKVRVYKNNINLGYGGNQKRGYLYAQQHAFDIVVLLHGDGQYAPEELETLIQPIIDGKADAVFGSRMLIPGAARKGGMPLYKFIGNKILTTLQNTLLKNTLLKTKLSEFHSGYRAYRVASLSKLPLMKNSNDFHFDTQIIIQLLDAGFRIKEVPIPVYYGEEICHVNGIKYAFEVTKATIKYRLHKTGLFNYPEYITLPDAVKYQIKHNKHSSHKKIISLLGNDIHGAKILDVGCGVGLLANEIAQLGGSVYGVDLAPSEVIDNKNLTQYFSRDLENGLNLPNELLHQFDVIIFADILEHLRHPDILLVECTRYMNPGGCIIASTGNVAHIFIRLMLLFGFFSYTEKGILDKTHTKLFTKSTFIKLFNDAGFKVNIKQFTPIPFENIFNGKRMADIFCELNMWFVRILPNIFAYQFVFKLTHDAAFLANQKREKQLYAPYIDEQNE